MAIACRDEADRTLTHQVIGGGDFAAWTAQRTREEVSAELGTIPVVPVADIADSISAAVEIDIGDGRTAMVRHEPILWEGERLPLRRASEWFEHTEEVLTEIGYSAEQITELIVSNVLH